SSIYGLSYSVNQPAHPQGHPYSGGHNHQLEVESRRREEPLLSFLVNRVRNWFSGLRMSVSGEVPIGKSWCEKSQPEIYSRD
ncbi:hypothetical protein HKBW3S25_01692, partial [Candidatus Hakubella thermalkaliphila]